MKTLPKVALLLLVVAGSFSLYDTFFSSSAVPDTPPDVKLPCSAVTEIDFALALNTRAAGGSRSIFAVTPKGTPKTAVLTLEHESKLATSGDVLCAGSIPDATTCGQINAFSWGYDWLPLKAHASGEPYCLDSLSSPAEDAPGWAVLYFIRENEIFGLAWGEALAAQWPPAQNPNLIQLTSSYPSISAQEPLHTPADLDIPTRILLGLDFNSWVNPIGAGGPLGTQNCFPLPPDPAREARLYYAAPSTGDDLSGMMIWYTEPELDGDHWIWSSPLPLSPDPIPSFRSGTEIDSLGFDQQLDKPGSGRGKRHLLISLVNGGTPLYPLDEGGLERGPGNFYIVQVNGDDGVASFEDPQPVYIELAPGADGAPGDQVLLQAIIGPRSRGTCPTDPTFYRREQTE